VSGLILGRAETWAADLADDMSVSEIDPAGQLRVFGAKIVPEGDDYSHSQASNVYGQISPQSASNSRSSSRAPSRRPSRHQIPEFSGRRSLTLSPQLPKRQLVKRGSAPSIVQSHQDVVDWQRLMRECPDPELSTPARAMSLQAMDLAGGSILSAAAQKALASADVTSPTSPERSPSALLSSEAQQALASSGCAKKPSGGEQGGRRPCSRTPVIHDESGGRRPPRHPSGEIPRTHSPDAAPRVPRNRSGEIPPVSELQEAHSNGTGSQNGRTGSKGPAQPVKPKRERRNSAPSVTQQKILQQLAEEHPELLNSGHVAF